MIGDRRYRRVLFELGLTYCVFDRESVAVETMQSFKLVVWDDLGSATRGLQNNEVTAFQQAFNAGIPIFFIGERFGGVDGQSDTACPGTVDELNHLTPATAQGGDGTVRIIVTGNHPSLTAGFGLVADFATLRMWMKPCRPRRPGIARQDWPSGRAPCF